MKRQSGVLMHVSSLPGKYSIGSFGDEALGFVDFLSESGFSVWQVLPFGMTDEYNSPYKSCASFGANPYFIDLPTLREKGLISDAELKSAEQKGPYLCEFERLFSERVALLSRAALRKRETGGEREVDAFLSDKPELLSAAKFLALSEANGGVFWQTWRVDEPDPERLFVWKFIQYEFYNQWMRVKKYANERGISIIGDLPMYVDLYSADVWARPEYFQLDGDNFPRAVAGVPPDAFSEEGQLWGNPLYDWDKMAEDGYAFWRRRIEYSLTLFDGVRIDHFRALEAYWSIPRDAESAKAGRWIKGPGRPLVKVLREAAGDKLIIAEDLGVITKGVESLLKYSTFPGMRVFQFGFIDGADNPHLPHNYSENSVAYSGTHDNNTLLGYLFEVSEEERERIFDYCSVPSDNITEACFCVMKTLLASHASRVIFPIQDILAFGKDTRMNTPGVAVGNWAYRVEESQILSIDRKKLKYLNGLYSRF